MKSLLSRLVSAALAATSLFAPATASADGETVARIETSQGVFHLEETGCYDDTLPEAQSSWGCTTVSLTRPGQESSAWFIDGGETFKDDVVWARALTTTKADAAQPVLVATQHGLFRVEDFGNEGGITPLFGTTMLFSEKVLDMGERGLAIALLTRDSFFGGIVLVSVSESGEVTAKEVLPLKDRTPRVGVMFLTGDVLKVHLKCTPLLTPEACTNLTYDLKKGSWAGETATFPE